PARTKDENPKVAQSRGLQFCQPNPRLSGNNNNNGFNPDATRLAPIKTNPGSALDWSSKATNFSSSDRNWRRRPVSTSAQSPVGLSPNEGSSTTKWKQSGTTSQPGSADGDNPILSVSSGPTQLFQSPKAPESSDFGAPSATSKCGPDQEVSRESNNLNQLSSGTTSLQDADSDVHAPQQTQCDSSLDPSFVSPASKNLSAMQTKRAVSAYYGIQSASQKCFGGVYFFKVVQTALVLRRPQRHPI
ncbi:unnamed protein product, partial [Echinostoma caproni]|uniref:BAT2_N domain-containing protein n=1 Tax=Echinostoma caproni TaxID=27848 RepID=A0A183AWE4_9TREM